MTAREWHRKAWGHKLGPAGQEKPTLRGGEYASYRAAVRRALVKAQWATRKVTLPPTDDLRIHDKRCEHCAGPGPVVIVKPGVISGHEDGDFVCARCDPRVAHYITTVGLMKMTGVLEDVG